MLTLAPGCACDVCAEEYGPHRLPHSIPCGHVLCASCCATIVEKTSPRLAPVCPFCREQFTHESARLIRMDFTTSGWSTPRRFPAMETLTDFNSEMLQRKTAHLLSSSGGDKTRIEVRRLEDKVAKVAAKKCSVEEVSSLYKELEEWLLAEKDDQTSSILLSAALLRAILMNHLAHSEASKTAKTTEANLKNKIEDLDHANSKMEAEIRRQRSQYNQKSQECQQLRNEVAQLRALATTLGVTPPELPPAPTSPTPSPTPYSSSQSPYSPGSSTTPTPSSAASPLSRFNAMHSRSASMSSRPTTPASLSASASAPLSPTRSHTPAPPRSHTPGPTRSHTPGPGHSSASAAAAAAMAASPRSHTPGPGSHTPSLRSQTPSLRAHTPAPPSSASHYHSHHAPPMPSLPLRYATPAPSTLSSAHGGHRTQTPAPLVPPKPRRLSTPSPPKMMVRSTSEEKAEAHERWIPPGTIVNHDDDYVVRPSERERESGKDRYGVGLGLGRSGSVRPASRTGFAARFGF